MISGSSPGGFEILGTFRFSLVLHFLIMLLCSVSFTFSGFSLVSSSDLGVSLVCVCSLLSVYSRLPLVPGGCLSPRLSVFFCASSS